MRPILMTSASILGSMPLAIASGAGANARLSMGTVVSSGLLVATVPTLCVTLVFHVAAERLRGERAADHGEAPTPSPTERAVRA